MGASGRMIPFLARPTKSSARLRGQDRHNLSAREGGSARGGNVSREGQARRLGPGRGRGRSRNGRGSPGSETMASWPSVRRLSYDDDFHFESIQCRDLRLRMWSCAKVEVRGELNVGSLPPPQLWLCSLAITYRVDDRPS